MAHEANIAPIIMKAANRNAYVVSRVKVKNVDFQKKLVYYFY